MKPALLLLGALGILTVSLAAQSLGEVAKKAEEARKVARPASKAYSDKDLKDAESKPAPGPAAAATATAPPPSIEQSESDRKDEYRRIARKDEAYWKERMRNAQSALDADRTFLAAASAREAELAKRLDRNAGDALASRDRRRADVDGQWQAAVTEVSRLKAAVETDRQTIATLQDEARRANVPPGWLRP